MSESVWSGVSVSPKTSLVVVWLALASTGTAPAEGLAAFGPTHLVDVAVGSAHTHAVASAARDYELADGTPAGVPELYSKRWHDVSVLMMTEFSPTTALLWGVSLGDNGKKYRIDPTLRLGFVHSDSIGSNLVLSTRVVVRLGGHLHEKPCTADYGDVAGVQQVNCRLAASHLAPEDTLPLLFNEPPPDRVEASINLTWTF